MYRKLRIIWIAPQLGKFAGIIELHGQQSEFAVELPLELLPPGSSEGQRLTVQITRADLEIET